MLEVRVRDSLSLPASALIRISDPQAAEHRLASAPARRQGGHQVRRDGRRPPTSALFKGEVVALEPEFTQKGCDHRGARLRRLAPAPAHHRRSARSSRSRPTTWSRRSARRPASPGTADATGFVYKFFQQSGETDRDFIRRFERAYDYEFVDRGRQVPVPQGGQAQGRADRAALRRAAADLPARGCRRCSRSRTPRCAGWDVAGKREIVGQATARPTPHGDRRSAATTSTSAFGRRRRCWSPTARSRAPTEADKMAQATIGRRAESFVEAEGTCHRQPGRAGRQGDQDRRRSGSKLERDLLRLRRRSTTTAAARATRPPSRSPGRSARGLLDLDAPAAEARLGLEPGRGHRDQRQRPRLARPRAREVPDAARPGRPAGEQLGADRDRRRAATRAAC